MVITQTIHYGILTYIHPENHANDANMAVPWMVWVRAKFSYCFFVRRTLTDGLCPHHRLRTDDNQALTERSQSQPAGEAAGFHKRAGQRRRGELLVLGCVQFVASCVEYDLARSVRLATRDARLYWGPMMAPLDEPLHVSITTYMMHSQYRITMFIASLTQPAISRSASRPAGRPATIKLTSKNNHGFVLFCFVSLLSRLVWTTSRVTPGVQPGLVWCFGRESVAMGLGL